MLERINQAMRARLGNEDGGDSEANESGFTLVELLIVVVVLGILAAVTVFGLSGTTSTSYKAACNADARSVEIAAEAYHANNAPNWPATVAILTQQDAANNNVVYLRTQPHSPKYTVTLAANGAVLVDGVNGAAPQPPNDNYDAGVNSSTATVNNNPCNAIP